MFHLAKPEDIGRYLEQRIDALFPSKREFCRRYLERVPGGEPGNDGAVTNMANRISQMIRGNKSVQISDLPVFAELLHVTCEQLLSAGGANVPEKGRLTNYSTAGSDKRKVWDRYLAHGERLYAKDDEYGRTMLDYALDFKNYPLLQYLVEREFIWFEGKGGSDWEYPGKLGAGTKLAFHAPDRTQNTDMLRCRLIEIAVEQGDLAMLERMCAREIPTFYFVCNPYFPPPDCERFYDERMLRAIAAAGDEIVEYFSRPFEVEDRFKNRSTFIFPFLGQMIDLMLKDRPRQAAGPLEQAAAHNREVYERLKERLDEAEHEWKYENAPWILDPTTVTWNLPKAQKEVEMVETLWADRLRRALDLSEEGNIVRFQPPTGNPKDGILSDLVRVTGSAKFDRGLQEKIDAVNEWYGKVADLCGGEK